MSPKNNRRRRAVVGCAAAGAAASLMIAGPAQANTEVEWPDEFTSAFSAMAVPEEVIDSEGEVSPGEEGATGDFMLWVNSDTEVICYEITLEGVTGDYESPAVTATHIHDAAAGEFGPPKLAFEDPEPVGDGPRTSSGCMEGPFVTGVEDDDGNDHGEGFSLAELEADPAAFAADSHTEDYPDGVVRGQLTQVPLDGVETGGGGTSAQAAVSPAAGAGALVLLGAGALALFVRRARATQV